MAKIGKNDRLDRDVRQPERNSVSTTTPKSQGSRQTGWPADGKAAALYFGLPGLKMVPRGRDLAERNLREYLKRVPSLRLVGPLYPPTVKPRSKRGWTTPKAAA